MADTFSGGRTMNCAAANRPEPKRGRFAQHAPAWISALCAVATVLGFGAGFGTGRVTNEPPSPVTRTVTVTVQPHGKPAPSNSAVPDSGTATSTIALADEKNFGLIVNQTDDDRIDVNAADVEITGTKFLNAFKASCLCQADLVEEVSVDVNLSGKYRMFDGTFGVTADSPQPGKVRFTVINVDNGTNLRDEQLSYQNPDTRPIPVTGVQRLRFTFRGNLGVSYGAIGDPRVST